MNFQWDSMNAQLIPPVPVSPPSQFVSKVDKSDRRRLQVGADSYVHGNEESDTSNQSMVYYNRNGKARRLRTGR